MKFIGESYSLYAKDIHQIWCRPAKFLWKLKFCSESGSRSGSWYYFGFQYQTYRSANSFEIYCVYMNSPCTYVHPDRQTEILFGLFCRLRHTNHEHFSKGDSFFYSLMRLQYFFFYILRMWWESKNIQGKICVSFPLLVFLQLRVYKVG